LSQASGYYFKHPKVKMEIKAKVKEVLEHHYAPVKTKKEASITVTTTTLFTRFKEVYPDLQNPQLVADVLDELGYIVADEGELDFVWLMVERPVL
jgi:hypothetical protein